VQYIDQEDMSWIPGGTEVGMITESGRPWGQAFYNIFMETDRRQIQKIYLLNVTYLRSQIMWTEKPSHTYSLKITFSSF
jgi:hypothetical protein